MKRKMNREKINKYLKFGSIALLFIVIQTVFGIYIEINDIVPDLFFAFVIFYACINGKFKEVVIVAMVYGIISDFVCHSEFVGCTAMYTYCAAIVYFVKNLFIKPNIVFLSVIALVTFIFGKSLLYPVLLLNTKIGFSYYFANDIIPSAFYNTVCFFVIDLIWVIAQKRREKNNAA